MNNNKNNKSQAKDKQINQPTENINNYISSDDATKNEIATKAKKKQPLINQFAKVIFIFAIITFVLSLVPVGSTFFLLLYIVVLVCVALLTLLTLFLNKGFNDHFKSVMSFKDVLTDLIKYTPYLLSASTILFGLCALLSLISKKRKEKIVLIIFSFILMIIAGIVAISLFINK